MSNLSGKTFSRRQLLFRSSKSQSAERAGMPNRLPWADGPGIENSCTGCGACVAACPENIIVLSENRKASVDFSKGECVFCEACAESCSEPVFINAALRAQRKPWIGSAFIDERCLSSRGITCQICKDQCPEAIISFPPVIGGAATPIVNAAGCTACGACLSPCPTEAIDIHWEIEHEDQQYHKEEEWVE
tara:strand:+ start:775 stop:1344 length:570 start_codon:yes stop_codon:yes gene_type:complete